MTGIVIAFVVGLAGPFVLLLALLADKSEPRPPTVDLREAYRPTMIASEARRYLGIR